MTNDILPTEEKFNVTLLLTLAAYDDTEEQSSVTMHRYVEISGYIGEGMVLPFTCPDSSAPMTVKEIISKVGNNVTINVGTIRSTPTYICTLQKLMIDSGDWGLCGCKVTSTSHIPDLSDYTIPPIIIDGNNAYIDTASIYEIGENEQPCRDIMPGYTGLKDTPTKPSRNLAYWITKNTTFHRWLSGWVALFEGVVNIITLGLLEYAPTCDWAEYTISTQVKYRKAIRIYNQYLKDAAICKTNMGKQEYDGEHKSN